MLEFRAWPGDVFQINPWEHGVGFSWANRRETRKLGLLHMQKFRSRTRAKFAAGANERVCGECPTQMLIYYTDPPSPLYVPPSYVVVTFYAKW